MEDHERTPKANMMEDHIEFSSPNSGTDSFDRTSQGALI